MSRILIFINHSLSIYKFRRELPESLLKMGHEVYLCYPNHDKDEYFESIGCKLIHFGLERKTKNPFKEVLNIVTFKKLCKKIKPDILLTYTIKCCWYGSYVNKNIKKIATITGQNIELKESKGIKRAFYNYLVKRNLKYNFVFFQNRSDLDWYCDFFKKESDKFVSVPGSGVNTSSHPFYKMINNDPFVFSFVGRLIKEKGIYEFLDAVSQIDSKNLIFNIAGPCEDEKILSDIKSINDGRIRYLGDLENINDLYKESSCVVVPSYSEGMCNALLEAQSCGRPVIASNIPGCKETFIDGESGIAIEPRNSKSLLSAMEVILKKDKTELEHMGKKGNEHVSRNFDRFDVVDEYLKKINELLATK